MTKLWPGVIAKLSPNSIQLSSTQLQLQLKLGYLFFCCTCIVQIDRTEVNVYYTVLVCIVVYWRVYSIVLVCMALCWKCTPSYWFAWHYAENVLHRTGLHGIMLKMYSIVLVCMILCWKCTLSYWFAYDYADVHCTVPELKSLCLYPEEGGHCIFFLCSLPRAPGFLLLKYECRRDSKTSLGWAVLRLGEELFGLDGSSTLSQLKLDFLE